VYQIRTFFYRLFLIKLEIKEGSNEKKLLRKISKIHEECINKFYIKYAGQKTKSVESLKRTTTVVTHAGGCYYIVNYLFYYIFKPI